MANESGARGKLGTAYRRLSQPIARPIAALQAGQATGPFFLAGTGRCGTSHLRRVLGEHPLVHAMKWETRFLIDPGGFEDLARALTDAYTPYHADDALRRLSWLLNCRLTGHSSETFRGWGLAEEVGPEHYRATVDWLWERLAWYEFDEAVPPLSNRSGRWQYAPDEARTCRRVVGRYFADRGELIAILREFTSRLFGAATRRAGKRAWCEKTPLNLLSAAFLHELYPQAKIVVIMRHPVQIVASHLDQRWAPSSLDGVLNWLEPIYLRWLAQRPALLGDARYVEMKAEDLAADWPARRRELFGRLGLPDAYTPSTFSAAQLRHRDGQLDDGQIGQIAGRLGWVAAELGYSPM